MNTFDSFSAVESSMEDESNRRNRSRMRARSRSKPAPASIAVSDGEEEDGDPELWKNFDQNFGQVQTVLDRNRALIQQVNENHQSRIPDNMVKNVALIQEINGNISKVRSLYSDLGSNFTTYFHNNKSQNGKPDNLRHHH
ncbi:hypothetical protein F8388_016344 [Cannabis sativa]|uniref:Protein EARLY FLOWERING 4 domain-containing protein n=2 Tax=Cannabis sativa TaxID=3483 RepID=A0A7J6GT33_CANSA|nr:hypothetical protein G4B88_007183 [Cannabis sativa]KAF4386092.1 hypothetical protein F8388_016344 [Cannabis sativa]KAF4395741.1 hypothetical protein G4B88_013515 [Cannabis sativa]